MYMFNQFLLLILVAVVNISLAVFVLVHDYRSWVNRTFFIFVSVLSFWTVCVAILLQQKTLLWSDLVLLFGPLLGVSSFLLFSKHYPNQTEIDKKSLLYFLLIPLSLFIVLTPFRPFVSGIIVKGDQIEPVIGPLYPVLMIWSVLGALFGIIILFRKFRKSHGSAKIQLRYLFFGFFTFLLLVSITSVILPALGNAEYAFFGPILTIIFTSFVAYSIIRHRFLDIRVILRKSLIITFTLVVSLIVVITLLMLSKQFIASLISIPDDWLVLLAVVILLVVFPTLKTAVTKLVNYFLFSDYIDFSVKIEELEKMTGMHMLLQDILQQIYTFIQENIQTDVVYVLLQTKQDRKHMVAAWPIHDNFTLDSNHILVELCTARHDMVIKDELASQTERSKVENQVLEMMKHHNIAAAACLQLADNDVFGMILVGDSRTKQELSIDQINLLKRLVSKLNMMLPALL